MAFHSTRTTHMKMYGNMLVVNLFHCSYISLEHHFARVLLLLLLNVICVRQRRGCEHSWKLVQCTWMHMLKDASMSTVHLFGGILLAEYCRSSNAVAQIKWSIWKKKEIKRYVSMSNCVRSTTIWTVPATKTSCFFVVFNVCVCTVHAHSPRSFLFLSFSLLSFVFDFGIAQDNNNNN